MSKSIAEEPTLSLICRSCTHCGAILQGRSYLKPDSICASCGGLLPNLTPEKVAELLAKEQRHNSPSKNHSSSSDSASKLIDCLDCGSSISSSAFFCMKCGRPSSLTAERAKTQGCAMMLLIYVLTGLVVNESIKWIIQGVLNSR